MKIRTLKDRILKAKEKIERKENTIIKKTALIEKKKTRLVALGVEEPLTCNKYDFSGETYWLMCDIGYLQDDITRGRKEIEETKNTLEKYQLQLAGELEKESIFLKDIPELMKQLQVELVDTWDTWDIDRRNRMKADYKKLGWKEFYDKYKGSDYSFMDKTDEQIHNSNVQDSKMLILDLFYRVKNITGEITDWSNIKACAGTHGLTILNGFVIGKEGRAEVESIYAGGYNVQRLHIRVLVKEYI